MEKMVYTREDLITRTLLLLNEGRNDFNGISRQEVKRILDAYENVITECLREANSDTPEIETKPIYGIKITATYKPAGIKTMYGEPRQTKEKISLKAKTTKYFGYAIVNGN